MLCSNFKIDSGPNSQQAIDVKSELIKYFYVDKIWNFAIILVSEKTLVTSSSSMHDSNELEVEES